MMHSQPIASVLPSICLKASSIPGSNFSMKITKAGVALREKMLTVTEKTVRKSAYPMKLISSVAKK